jgi:hypothetical protein
MLLDLIGSAGFGTVLGGLFGWLGKREENAIIEKKMKHEVSMVKAKTDASIQVAKMGIETAKVAGQLIVDKVEASAFATSQVVGSTLAGTIKSMIRPIILGLLMYQTYMIIQSLEKITGGLSAMEADDVTGLYRIIVLSVTGLTSTAVGWYFAARSSKQFDKLIDKWDI